MPELVSLTDRGGACEQAVAKTKSDIMVARVNMLIDPSYWIMVASAVVRKTVHPDGSDIVVVANDPSRHERLALIAIGDLCF